MSQEQYTQTVAAQQEWEYEAEARQIDRANEILAEMRATRDEEFRADLESKFPILKGWK